LQLSTLSKKQIMAHFKSARPAPYRPFRQAARTALSLKRSARQQALLLIKLARRAIAINWPLLYSYAAEPTWHSFIALDLYVYLHYTSDENITKLSRPNKSYFALTALCHQSISPALQEYASILLLPYSVLLLFALVAAQYGLCWPSCAK